MRYDKDANYDYFGAWARESDWHGSGADIHPSAIIRYTQRSGPVKGIEKNDEGQEQS
jgi:hypothetical protein